MAILSPLLTLLLILNNILPDTIIGVNHCCVNGSLNPLVRNVYQSGYTLKQSLFP
ncbi:MAG: hypothetical protein SOX94_04320 [Prevotella sp.]|nr:hypothetical protein [Prevotella sp.]